MNENLSRKPTKKGKSFYEALGIEKDATPSEIKKAYHKKALRCHPDKNPNNKEAEEQFQTINHANEILSNEKKRKIYD